MRTWGPPGGRYATTRPAAQGRMGARWSAAHATRPAQDRFWDTQWLHLVPHGCNWSHMAAPGPARLAVHRQRRAHAEVRLTQTSTATLKPAQHCGSPGPGRKFWKGSSALMRHSIAWPLNWMSSWLQVWEQGGATGISGDLSSSGGRGSSSGGTSGGGTRSSPHVANDIRGSQRLAHVPPDSTLRALQQAGVCSREAQRLAHGHPDLLLDQVHSRDHLSHRVLHLHGSTCMKQGVLRHSSGVSAEHSGLPSQSIIKVLHLHRGIEAGCRAARALGAATPIAIQAAAATAATNPQQQRQLEAGAPSSSLCGAQPCLRRPKPSKPRGKGCAAAETQ